MYRRAVALILSGVLASTSAAAQDLPVFDGSQFGQVVIRDNQSVLGKIRNEAQIGQMNIEFISNYSASSPFARMGRAVGKLDILTDTNKFAPCTAFLIDGNRVVTNHHCVPGILDHPQIGGTKIAAVKLHLGFIRDGVAGNTRSFDVDPVPLETSKALDYTVLQVIGEANAEFGALELSDNRPDDLAPFWVIGHPLGEAQRISREKCQASAPALDGNRLIHTCDTLPGSSGSPVIDTGLGQVIALHHASAGSVNLAVPMAEILAQSRVLKVAAIGKSPAAPNAEHEQQLAALRAQAEKLAEELAALKAGQAPVAAPGPDGERFGLAAGDMGLRIELAGQAKGTVVIDLFEELAPGHAARIADLARDGVYDGVVFHRVIDGFMAQTGDVRFGDFDDQDYLLARAGTGSSDLPDLKAEFSDIPFERGVVGMARSGDPHSANSQFFIMFDDGPFLNGQYTVIGRVVHGMEVVDAIKRGDRNSNGAVKGTPDRMAKVTVIE